MNILITGITGRLGQQLLKMLSGVDDVKIYSLGSHRDHGLPGVFKSFDVSDMRSGIVPFSEIDVMYHCAFSRSFDILQLSKSLEFAGEVFDWACRAHVGGIVNISSQSVYGVFRDKPSLESDQLLPADNYALAKYSAELLLNAMAGAAGVSYSSVRLASLVGVGMEERVVTKFVRQALVDRRICVTDGGQVFSFLDIEDAACGLVSMLSVSPKGWRNLYNLGTSESYTIVELAEAVRVGVRNLLSCETGLDVVASDAKYSSMMSVSRFSDDFGWMAKKSVNDVVAGIIACEARLG